MTSPTALVQFYLETTQTWREHRITVEVYSSRADLAAAALHSDHEVEDTGQVGVFMNAAGFDTRDAPLDMGRILYSVDDLDINTISHEVVHAAMFIYECDVLGNHARAVNHMTMTNEVIAYMIGSMMGQLAEKLLAAGLYDAEIRR